MASEAQRKIRISGIAAGVSVGLLFVVLITSRVIGVHIKDHDWLVGSMIALIYLVLSVWHFYLGRYADDPSLSESERSHAKNFIKSSFFPGTIFTLLFLRNALRTHRVPQALAFIAGFIVLWFLPYFIGRIVAIKAR